MTSALRSGGRGFSERQMIVMIPEYLITDRSFECEIDKDRRSKKHNHKNLRASFVNGA